MKIGLLKNLIKLVYTGFLYPLAKEFTEKTSNKYDDKALAFLDSLVDDLIGEIK